MFMLNTETKFDTWVVAHIFRVKISFIRPIVSNQVIVIAAIELSVLLAFELHPEDERLPVNIVLLQNDNSRAKSHEQKKKRSKRE